MDTKYYMLVSRGRALRNTIMIGERKVRMWPLATTEEGAQWLAEERHTPYASVVQIGSPEGEHPERPIRAAVKSGRLGLTVVVWFDADTPIMAHCTFSVAFQIMFGRPATMEEMEAWKGHLE